MNEHNPYAPPSALSDETDDGDTKTQYALSDHVPFSGSVSQQQFLQLIRPKWKNLLVWIVVFLALSILLIILIFSIRSRLPYASELSIVSVMFGSLGLVYVGLQIAGYLAVALNPITVNRELAKKPYLGQPMRGTWNSKRCEIWLSAGHLIFNPRATHTRLINEVGMSFHIRGFRIILLAEHFPEGRWESVRQSAKKAFQRLNSTGLKNQGTPPKHAVVVSRLNGFQRSTPYELADFWSRRSVLLISAVAFGLACLTIAVVRLRYWFFIRSIPTWNVEDKFTYLIRLFGWQAYYYIAIIAFLLSAIALMAQLYFRWSIRGSARYKGHSDSPCCAWFDKQEFVQLDEDVTIKRTWDQIAKITISQAGAWIFFTYGLPTFLPRLAFQNDSEWQSFMVWHLETWGHCLRMRPSELLSQSRTMNEE